MDWMIKIRVAFEDGREVTAEAVAADWSQPFHGMENVDWSEEVLEAVWWTDEPRHITVEFASVVKRDGFVRS